MNISIEELTRAIEKTTHAQRYPPKRNLEFSKIIMIFISVLCGGTWLIAAVAWFLWREFPVELVEYTKWFFVAAAAYMLKSGYENHAKIKNGREGNTKC